MNEISKQTNDSDDKVDAPVVRSVASPARRRLMKLGTAAVPVVATLASRPALAWHCQSPSAWGSEIINPNTSLKTNASHKTWVDETWTINNWKTNTPRTAVDLANGSDAGAPWNELCLACPTLKTISACNPGGKFKYANVKVSHLVQCGFVNPGFTSDPLVKDISSTDNRTYALIGQLNYAVLKRARFKNDIDMCLKDGQLNDMARLAYTENGVTWNMAKVKDYLHNNWIVRP
jgi:hypothetical protein